MRTTVIDTRQPKVRSYLTREEIDAILAALQWCGRRDYALLLTMYNTGARVSEISFLHQNPVRFGTKSYVQLHGKGRKERLIPLWPRTARILKEWFREIGLRDSAVAFPQRSRRTAFTVCYPPLTPQSGPSSCLSFCRPQTKTSLASCGPARDCDGLTPVGCGYCRHRALGWAMKALKQPVPTCTQISR